MRELSAVDQRGYIGGGQGIPGSEHSVETRLAVAARAERLVLLEVRGRYVSPCSAGRNARGAPACRRPTVREPSAIDQRGCIGRGEGIDYDRRCLEIRLAVAARAEHLVLLEARGRYVSSCTSGRNARGA